MNCGFASLQFRRVRLSRNYRLIGAPRKFDVLKTNILRRSNAQLRGQKRLILRINFQKGDINILLSFLFTTVKSSSSHQVKEVKAKLKIWNMKTNKNQLNSMSLFVQARLFTEKFPRTSTIDPGIFLGRDGPGSTAK